MVTENDVDVCPKCGKVVPTARDFPDQDTRTRFTSFNVDVVNVERWRRWWNDTYCRCSAFGDREED